jgi:hypothetical protein
VFNQVETNDLNSGITWSYLTYSTYGDNNVLLDLMAEHDALVAVDLNEQGVVSGSTVPSSETGFTAPGQAAAVCFAAGTMIQTIAGDVEIQDLMQGDMVLTKDRGYQPIRWIAGNTLSPKALHENENLRPIRIRAHARGLGLPQQDLVVSPQHRVLVSSKIAGRMFDGETEVLVAAKHLLSVDNIEIAHDIESVQYFHFLFDQHEVVFSNGAQTESLFTGPQALKSVSSASRVEFMTLFPWLADISFQATPVPCAQAHQRGARSNTGNAARKE